MDLIVVTAELRTPIAIGGGYLTLDAFLAARVFDLTNDLAEAHDRLPLASTSGLYHASAAIVEAQGRGRLGVVAALRASHDLDPEMLLKNKHGQVHKKLGLKRRRDFGNVTGAFHTIAAPTVTWYAEGDADAVERLLAGVRGVGARRQSGWGEVASWTVEPGELDGLLGYADEPLRPIPADLYRGDTSHPLTDAAWRPAYWNPRNRAACYAPPELAATK
jgi:hypothetical protein